MPYGSPQSSLKDVVRWFDGQYDLGLEETEISDLTAYLEAVGSGVDAYEDTMYTLEAELEEFSFFLSTIELLEARGLNELVDVTFRTVALELRAHKWDVQDKSYLPLLEEMASLIDAATEANAAGNAALMRQNVASYRDLYAENKEVLR